MAIIDNTPCHNRIQMVSADNNLFDHQLIRLGPFLTYVKRNRRGLECCQTGVKKDVALTMPSILESEITPLSSYQVEKLT